MAQVTAENKIKYTLKNWISYYNFILLPVAGGPNPGAGVAAPNAALRVEAPNEKPDDGVPPPNEKPVFCWLEPNKPPEEPAAPNPAAGVGAEPNDEPVFGWVEPNKPPEELAAPNPAAGVGAAPNEMPVFG